MTTYYQKQLRKIIIKKLKSKYMNVIDIDFNNILLLENMSIANNMVDKYSVCIYRINPIYDQNTTNIIKELIQKLLDSYSAEYSIYSHQLLNDKKHWILRINNGHKLVTTLKLI